MSGAAAPAGGGRGPRLATLLLAGLLVASLALRLWYLPVPERSKGEGTVIANIESVLAGGEVRHHQLPPAAWAPQLGMTRLAERLHEASGSEALNVATAKHRLTRRGLNLLRGLALVWGMGGLLLLYGIARRLHSTAVALLAVLVLGFSPWHIQTSIDAGPDGLVLCLSLLALWLALRALDRPTAARLALVGLALGGAAAVKLTGALVALPVLLGLVLGARRAPRRVLLALAIPLPLAVLTWWVLSAPLALYLPALAAEQARQASRAAQKASSRFTVAAFGLLHPLRETVHGRLIGTLALLGAAGQAFRCLFLVDPGPDRAHRLMVLAAVPVFILGYAWATPLYEEAGFVPLVAYSSLYAAVTLGMLWDGLAALAPALRGPRAAVLAGCLVALLIVPAGWRHVRSQALGSTVGAALDWLRRDFGRGGPWLVLVEEAALAGSREDAGELAGRLAARGVALRVVPRLAEAGGDLPTGADGEVFLRRELSAADATFYGPRYDEAAARRVVTGSLLWRRGPDLVALRHRTP